MQRPPRRMVISKAMTTKGGMETTGLPPVIRSHLSAVQIVSAKPAAVPVRPPDQGEEPHRAPRQAVSGQRLLELVEGHRAVGRDASASLAPGARGWPGWRCRRGRRRRGRSTSPSVRVAIPHRMRDGLLDLDDGHRRHHLDEAQEQDEEPGEAPDDDAGVDRQSGCSCRRCTGRTRGARPGTMMLKRSNHIPISTRIDTT